MDDLREARANWHDPAFRRDFLVGFAGSFVPRLLIGGLIGFLGACLVIFLLR